MHENAGHELLDVRDCDMADLVARSHGHEMKTALDRILTAGSSTNGFNNCIG
jgi:hypothetical protein